MFSGSALVQGFTKSFGMIFASEIGDKTFFIAALMAMKNPRGVVRTAGALLATLNSHAQLKRAVKPLCDLLRAAGWEACASAEG